jgi:HAD superfamily hydrolase (TIGR01490 family)
MNLILFDFDGTVTDCDSFLLFVRYAVGERKFLYGAAVLSPKIVLFKMGKYPNYRLKQDFLAHFFGGWQEEEFNRSARLFSSEKIPGIVRQSAMDCIRNHHEQGDHLVLVSASPENTLAPWCNQTGLDLLATRLESVDGRITGRLQGRNCWGDEKVVRVKKAYNINEFDQIYAYGDSSGDKAMLALADKSFYRHFT